MSKRPETTVRAGLRRDVPMEPDGATVAPLEGADKPQDFGELYGRVSIDNDSLDTKANVTEEGLINIPFGYRGSHRC